MLKFPQKKFKWSGKAQSGFYFDFIIKKFGEIFLRNFFITSALFLGEKYIIESLTKKTIDSFIFNTNRFIGWTTFNFMLFFWITIVFVLYILITVNLILLFLF